jgi:hypothetical protein
MRIKGGRADQNLSFDSWRVASQPLSRREKDGFAGGKCRRQRAHEKTNRRSDLCAKEVHWLRLAVPVTRAISRTRCTRRRGRFWMKPAQTPLGCGTPRAASECPRQPRIPISLTRRSFLRRSPRKGSENSQQRWRGAQPGAIRSAEWVSPILISPCRSLVLSPDVRTHFDRAGQIPGALREPRSVDQTQKIGPNVISHVAIWHFPGLQSRVMRCRRGLPLWAVATPRRSTLPERITLYRFCRLDLPPWAAAS